MFLCFTVTFNVFIVSETGTFEILEHSSLVATGKITVIAASTSFDEAFYNDIIKEISEKTSNTLHLEAPDIYKKFKLRCYDYGKEFR